jgi:hypothetical protein
VGKISYASFNIEMHKSKWNGKVEAKKTISDDEDGFIEI